MGREHFTDVILNDLPDLTKSNTFLFADDIKICRPIMNRDDHSILQQDITIIEQYRYIGCLNFTQTNVVIWKLEKIT